MRELILQRPEQGGSPHLNAVIDAIQQASSQVAKVYRTYCADEEKAYVFITTSKDIHLSLGAVFSESHIHLAKLLEEAFSHGDRLCVSLLLFLSGDKKNGIFVTLTNKNEKCMIYHLSPVH